VFGPRSSSSPQRTTPSSPNVLWATEADPFTSARAARSVLRAQVDLVLETPSAVVITAASEEKDDDQYE
jgi:hypothetical protein